MPRIFLVRHGQAAFGTDDYDVLSDRGAEQAVVAARALLARGIRNAVLVSGSLRRQTSTAEVMAAEIGVRDVQVDARWDEFDAYRIVERSTGPHETREMTSSRFQSALDGALAAWIDSADDEWRRFAANPIDAARDLAARIPSGSDAVVVTSAGTTAALCSYLLGTGTSGLVALNRVSVNAAITTLAARPDRLSLVSFNDHAHLLSDRRLLTNR